MITGWKNFLIPGNISVFKMKLSAELSTGDAKRRLERKGNQCINTGTLHIVVAKRSEHFVRKNKRPKLEVALYAYVT